MTWGQNHFRNIKIPNRQSENTFSGNLFQPNKTSSNLPNSKVKTTFLKCQQINKKINLLCILTKSHPMGNRKSLPNAKAEYFDRISCFSYLMQTRGRSENVLQFSIHATIYVLNVMFSDIIYIDLTFLLLFLLFRATITYSQTKHHIVVTLQLATRGQKMAANVGMDGGERLRTPVLVPVSHHRSTHHAASSLRITNNQELRTWAFCKNVLSFVPTSSRLVKTGDMKTGRDDTSAGIDNPRL